MCVSLKQHRTGWALRLGLPSPGQAAVTWRICLSAESQAGGRERLGFPHVASAYPLWGLSPKDQSLPGLLWGVFQGLIWLLWDSCAQGLQNMTVSPGPLLLGELNTALRASREKRKTEPEKRREKRACVWGNHEEGVSGASGFNY